MTAGYATYDDLRRTPPGLRWYLRRLRIRGIRKLARPFRAARLAALDALLAPLPRPLRILDVGGLEAFWRQSAVYDDPRVTITLLNLEAEPVSSPRLCSVAGDARDMRRWPDGRFDVVVSNSVIEHVGALADQERMAAEVRRVGRAYFVQTPYRYGLIEPHFLFPAYGALPFSARVWLLRHIGLGTAVKTPDRAAAEQAVSRVRLLDHREMRRLFPDAEMRDERVAGLTKSLIATRGL